jgi:hypothetical protein
MPNVAKTFDASSPKTEAPSSGVRVQIMFWSGTDPEFLLNGVFQILPKYRPIDPGVKPRRRVRAVIWFLQCAVVVVEQSGIV